MPKKRPSSLSRDIHIADARLAEAYGEEASAGPDHPLHVLVRTILSQNTTRANSSRAFQALVSRFDGWNEVANADVRRIAAAIKSGGLANQKAARIRAILREIIAEHGAATLDWLAEMPADAAGAYLRKFNGIGPKTAACVLLFALGREAFPVDTHVRRIAERLGWVQPGLSDDEIHRELGRLVPAKLCYQLHINMVQHGREMCRARSPRCGECVIGDLCDYGRDVSSTD